MEEERVKAEMREKLAELMMLNDILPVEVPATCHYDLADQILSIKGIRIESADQNLPVCTQETERIELQNWEQRVIDPEAFENGYASAEYDMRQAGFVKCKRREDGS